jgi:phosphoserine phosphatase
MTPNRKKNECETRYLVVFDVEGVLIPKNRYVLFEISRKISFLDFIQIIILGLFYEIGLLPLEFSLRKIFAMLKGLEQEKVVELHKKIPFIPGTEEVFKKLITKGYRTALISSGLPTLAVKDIAARLKADYAYGLELKIDKKHLTGKIGGDVIRPGGKATVLKEILEKEKLTSEDCIVVADDRNNLPMFSLCKLKIGYNPDFILAAKSDFVTRGSLTEILPPITGEKSSHGQPNLSNRGLREAIHMGSFLLTFISMYITGNVLLTSLILLIAMLYSISEIARAHGISIPIISPITWNAANKTELYEFATSPIYFALGMAISLSIFPEPIRYVAITVLTLGDGGAHIFGIRFGRTHLPFNKGKNIEGTLFGFICAFLGAIIFIDPIKALIAAIVGMTVEGLPSPINDNLTIPIATGLILAIIM